MHHRSSHWTQALEARFWMPEALRQRKLLRIAWALLAVLLLCGLQLGWLDRLWLDAGASGSGSQPEPRLSAYSVRRGLASGVSEQPAGSGNTAERGSQCSGPFHVEKVAFMFLVRGPIHHERTWAAWLSDAADFTPTPAAVGACCSSAAGSPQPGSGGRELSPFGADGPDGSTDGPSESSSASYGSDDSGAPVPGEHAEDVGSSLTAEAAEHTLRHQPGQRFAQPRRSLRWLRLRRARRQRWPNHEGIVKAQRLYSVYVHPAPRYPAYPRGHLFHGLEVSNRVKVTWGYHSVTAAMRLLLAKAVADPANTRFQFLDETSIPLYPPHLVWAQFMHETRTRMSACESQVSRVQWLPQFEGPHLKPSMWRKSSQWSMILRSHAELLVADTEIWDAITPLCEARAVINPATNTSKPYPCVSDEHYFATVVAAAGLSNETTCAGNAMHVDWARAPGNGSPFTYWMKDASLETINMVRGQKGRCAYMDMIRSVNQPGNFETPATLQHFVCPADSLAAHYMPYSVHVDSTVKCSMFSRKWAPSTRGLVYQALTNASQPAGVLAPRHAEQRTQDEAQAAARRQRKRALLPRWLRRRRKPHSV